MIHLRFYILFSTFLLLGNIVHSQIRKGTSLTANPNNMVCALNNTNNSSVIGWHDGEINLVKFDENGNEIFNIRETNQIDYLCDVELYNDTTYLLTRDTISGEEKVLLSTISSAGNLIHTVQLDSISKVYSEHQLHVYETQLCILVYQNDGFRIINFDKQLQLKWDLFIVPSDTIGGYNGGNVAVHECANNDLVVCGHRNRQLSIARISSNGSLRWVKNQINNFDMPLFLGYGITESDSANLYICGQIGNFAFGAPYIAKCDSAGNLKWIKSYPTNYGNNGQILPSFEAINIMGDYLHVSGLSQWSSDMRVITDLNGYMVSSTASNIHNVSHASMRPGKQMSVAQSSISPDSLYLEYVSYHDDYCESIDVVFSPIYEITGFSSDTLYLFENIQHSNTSFTGNLSFVSQGTFFNYLCGAAGDENMLNTNSLTNLEINIQPNPCINQLTIETAETTPLYLEIYNMSGQIIIQQHIKNNDSINLSHLNSGIYLAIITNDAGIRTHRKIIKE